MMDFEILPTKFSLEPAMGVYFNTKLHFQFVAFGADPWQKLCTKRMDT